MNASEIRNLLAGRAEDVCRLLLPSGKRVKREWHAGDVNGGPGDSLKVQLEGTYAGSWKDWGNDAHKGSLIDLWMMTKNVDFKTALEEAAKYLGVDLRSGEQRFYKQPAATATGNGERGTGNEEKRVDAPKRDFVMVKEGSEVFKYLTETRGLKPETLKAFRVGETLDGKAMVFPYLSVDGKRLIMAKYVALDRPDGKKVCWVSKNTQPALFGKQTVRAQHGDLVINEGEIDAMTVWQCGFSAVSVPFGAKGLNKDQKDPNDPWITFEYDFLEQFQNIYLCCDADEPGRKASSTLVKRLGTERCLLVRLPEDAKDPNELLMKKRLGELGKAIGEAKSLDPEHLKTPEDFRQETYEKFFPVDGKEPGIEFLWPIPFRIRPRELTVWTGYSGHGKTMLLSHLSVHLMGKSEKFCVASMEMEAPKTLQNFWRQASGYRKPSKEGMGPDDPFTKVYNWFNGKLWIYDRMGDVNAQEVLSVFTYAARRYGVKQFVVDSLCKLSVATDDYDGQRKILNDFCGFAKTHDAHVHLICHSKKPQHGNEMNIPGKYEVSGSAAIIDLAFNGITVWRNKMKEQKLKPDDPEYETDPEERGKWENAYDAYFCMWKQRHDGQEPVKKLWFDRESWQYSDEQGVRSIIYVP